MAIQTVDLTVPNGDTPRSANTKINLNFTDQTNAASRLVGESSDTLPTNATVKTLIANATLGGGTLPVGNASVRNTGINNGQIPLAEDVYKAAYSRVISSITAASPSTSVSAFEAGSIKYVRPDVIGMPAAIASDSSWYVETKFVNASSVSIKHQMAVNIKNGRALTKISGTEGFDTNWISNSTDPLIYLTTNATTGANVVVNTNGELQRSAGVTFSTLNTTKDSNGFLKGASPVVDLYNDYIEQNTDALEQSITFEKVSIGNHLVKGSLGFAQEGWYIETPKDANGNVLVAVVYEQLANNDISVKTYAKRFDEDTGDIVANLTKPRDIPVGRFISLRLHELPKEPPVMPNQDTSADAPAQTNNP